MKKINSGHQRHCTPSKPLLRPTKHILKIWQKVKVKNEKINSGHQRHCTPPKPLLRPTKNILKKIWQKTFAFVQTYSYTTYHNQFLTSVLLYCCIVMDMRSRLYRKVHIIMYEIPDLCLIQQHRCLDRGFPKTKLFWVSGTGHATKSEEFSETFQTAFEPPTPHFQKVIS